MTHVTTPSLSMDNYFTTTLTAPVLTSDTVISVASVPTASEGYLEIDEGLSTKEIIYYTSKGANFVTCPDATSGSGRGVGGTSVSAHISGATVKQKVTAEYWKELQNGHALGTSAIITSKINNAAVTADKLGLSPQTTTIITSQSTASTSYTDLATSGPAVTVTIGANGLALVMLTQAGNSSAATGTFMSFAASGANTIAAADSQAALQPANANTTTTWVGLLTGLSAGSTTFTAKYRAVSGTATFTTRGLIVIPL